MSIYHEKARELGELMLKSTQAENVMKARELFYEDREAVKKMDEYNAFQDEIQSGMRSGALTEAEFNIAATKLKDMGTELKKNAVIKTVIDAENEYGAFVNEIMSILRFTITGESDEGCGCGCGGHGDCDDCDEREDGECGCEGDSCGCMHN